MKPFTLHTGITAPLLRNNIDTDAIIPSREMKRVSKRGLSEGLFAAWRYTDVAIRTPNPDFVLNQADYQNSSILLAGSNFGCGSSREHAVWALAEYGIRAIIAPSFGSIFYNNCVRNGILPIELSAEVVATLAKQVQLNPQQHQINIDLHQQTLWLNASDPIHFEIAPPHRQMLLEGLDPIALTLQSDAAIQQFIQRDRQQRPWIYEQN